MSGRSSAFVSLPAAYLVVTVLDEWLVHVAWVKGEIDVDNASVTSQTPYISFPARGHRRVRFCLNTIAARLDVTSMSFVSFNNLPNPSTNVLAIKQQQPPPVVDLDVLQAASRVLQEQLLKDAQIIPDYGEMFAYGAHLHFHLVQFPVFLRETAGSSGQYSVFPDDYRVPFLKRKLAGIPEGLFQYFTGA